MYPQGAATHYVAASGTTSGVFENSSSTVYGLHIQQSKDMSETVILCGSQVIAHNYAKDYPLDLIQHYCPGDLRWEKTGNDVAFISITYSTSSGDRPGYVQNFSYGELTNSTFLFLIFSVLAFWFLTAAIIRHKKQK